MELKITGTLRRLDADKTVLSTREVDIERVGELFNAAGYLTSEFIGKRLTITIEETKEG